jgi:diaminobutyrate-2-oxoglutarate transaminase
VHRGADGSGQDVDRPARGSAFALLWLSETTFDLGSALMNFALGVWIFQTTGSAEQFSGAIVAAALPALLMTPLTGALADRFDRRWLIAGCDIASVLMIGLLAWLLSHDELAVRHLYFFNAGTSVVVSLRAPAYAAALGAIVPGDKLTQAGGLVSATQGLLQIGAPLLAGYLMGAVGLAGVVVVEMIVATAGTIAAFGALSRARHAIRGVVESESLPIFQATVASFSSALRYFREVPLMVGLAAYGVLHDSLLMLAGALLTPLVLSTHSSNALGTILTSGASGGLAGSALLVFTPVARRLMLWMLLCNAGLSLFVVLAGFAASLLPWCVCAFLAFFCGSASGVCVRTLWVRKTHVARRGSILALLNSFSLLATCMVMLVGGGLGEHVFEPALAVGGAWADTVGAWVGTGKGRGLGLMFIVCGGAGLLMSLLALTHTRLRRLDELVLDQPDDSLHERLSVREVAT